MHGGQHLWRVYWSGRYCPRTSRHADCDPCEPRDCRGCATRASSAGYPIANVEFSDPDYPLQVSLEAFNPMVPLDTETSGLPAAIFIWRLCNPGPETVDTTVVFSMANAAGHDGLTSLEHEEEAIWLQPSGPAFGGNVNQWIDDGAVRGLKLSGTKVPTSALGAGTLAVATPWAETTFLEHWERAGWYDPLENFWEDFRTDGRLPDESTADPSPDGRSDIGSLGLCAAIEPGEGVSLPFVVAWHFPNLTNYWDAGSPALNARLGNWYATQFPDAWSVASDVVERLGELTDRTRGFRDTLFSSTLPESVLDAVSSQMSIARTATCLRTSDGVFHGFEGCNDHAGSCPMDCTHVWNYEQALAHLFPELERTMRDTDFLVSTRPSGEMAFRSILPVSLNYLWDYMPAADGQLGSVLKLFREWQLSGDTDWLQSLWPRAKRAIEWSWEPNSWDPDRDGVMEGEQHTTYDIEFFGPNAMTGTIYLGALKAAARMAAALGDREAFDRYSEIYLVGSRKLDALLWNGEYYGQLVPEAVEVENTGRPDWSPSPLPGGETELRYQFGDGCLADQLLGQWFCHVAGLGYVLPEARVKRTIEAVFRNNWKPDLSKHESCQRTYALNEEAGLLLCTWPHGGRPKYPFPYADEVWTGVEYQVAAHLIYEGLVDEGLLVVDAVRARHDGVRRNPWNEFECGHHYARAMASWSVLLALSGYHFSALEQKLRFAPGGATRRFSLLFLHRLRMGPICPSPRSQHPDPHGARRRGRVDAPDTRNSERRCRRGDPGDRPWTADVARRRRTHSSTLETRRVMPGKSRRQGRAVVRIVDAHNDLLIETVFRKAEPNPFAAHYLGKLEQGRIGLQVCPLSVDMELYPSQALEKGLEQVAAWHRILRENGDRVVAVRSVRDLAAVEDGSRIGLLLAMEGVEPFGYSVALADVFWELGVRMMALCWNRRNVFADGAGEAAGGGLSVLGLELVDRLAQLGIVLDLAHASDRTFSDVLERAPDASVIVSHACCRAVCDTPTKPVRPSTPDACRARRRARGDGDSACRRPTNTVDRSTRRPHRPCCRRNGDRTRWTRRRLHAPTRRFWGRTAISSERIPLAGCKHGRRHIRTRRARRLSVADTCAAIARI